MYISSGSGSARRSPAGLRPSPIHHRGDAITCWSPSHRDIQSICFPITTDPNHPGITLARKTQSFYFLVRETNHSVVRILQTELPSFYLSQKVDVHAESQLPAEYHDLAEAFSKTKATQLPPHRTGDCAIDLQPGSQPPKGRIFPLSQPEVESMKSYIEEELAKGFLRPFTSPASAGFFFVKKKDGGLRPCIDYRGLNDITIKFRYPLPLVPAALEQLREARYFTKLDLRSTYNLIRIREGDEWKTAFSTTTGHYEYLVMPFGLANSPSVFQSFINEVFRDMLNRWVNCLYRRHPDIFHVTRGSYQAGPSSSLSSHRPSVVRQGREV